MNAGPWDRPRDDLLICHNTRESKRGGMVQHNGAANSCIPVSEGLFFIKNSGSVCMCLKEKQSMTKYLEKWRREKGGQINSKQACDWELKGHIRSTHRMFSRQSAAHCTCLIPCGRNERLRSRENKKHKIY